MLSYSLIPARSSPCSPGRAVVMQPDDGSPSPVHADYRRVLAGSIRIDGLDAMPSMRPGLWPALRGTRWRMLTLLRERGTIRLRGGDEVTGNEPRELIHATLVL